MFRKLLYNDDSQKKGGIIGKTMTQNTTNNDKREQCDTNYQRTENLFNEKKFTLHPVPPAHTPASVYGGYRTSDLNWQPLRYDTVEHSALRK